MIEFDFSARLRHSAKVQATAPLELCIAWRDNRQSLHSLRMMCVGAGSHYHSIIQSFFYNNIINVLQSFLISNCCAIFCYYYHNKPHYRDSKTLQISKQYTYIFYKQTFNLIHCICWVNASKVDENLEICSTVSSHFHTDTHTHTYDVWMKFDIERKYRMIHENSTAIFIYIEYRYNNIYI